MDFKVGDIVVARRKGGDPKDIDAGTIGRIVTVHPYDGNNDEMKTIRVEYFSKYEYNTWDVYAPKNLVKPEQDFIDHVLKVNKLWNYHLFWKPAVRGNMANTENSTPQKTTTVVDSKDLKEKVPDVVLYGNPDTWKLICKASSNYEGWMKSTKAMEIEGLGILVQVSTQQGAHVAEALHFIRDATIEDNGDGDIHIRRRTWEDDLSPTAREHRRREFLTEEDDPE